jgi:nicotinamide-nucleotide amidase
VAVTGGARVIAVGPGVAGAGVEDEARALALALEAAGIPVASRTFVDADEAAVERALAAGAPLTAIVAGARGSEGDLVRRAVARVTGTRLVLNDRALALLTARHRRVDRPLTRAAERQALLPQGAVVWETADAEPAWAVESADGIVAVLPRGTEIRSAVERDLVPFVQPRWPGPGAARARILRTAGVSAAEIEERLGDRLTRPRPGGGGETSATLLAVEGEVWVRVQARGATAQEAATTLTAAEAALAGALGDDCYGRNGERLEEVVGRLLQERGLTLAVAESCTGGLVASRLTDVAGSSAYFERGVVAYSNRTKRDLLGIPEEILRAHGAVSAPCAEAMARAVCAQAGSDCGLAVTGIGGPDGGTLEKPVGTVFIGLSVGGSAEARRYLFLGDRHAVKGQAAVTALDLLRRRLLALPPHRP